MCSGRESACRLVARRRRFLACARLVSLPAPCATAQAMARKRTTPDWPFWPRAQRCTALRPAAAEFTRDSGIAVAVSTDHGHNIRKHALTGEAKADIVLVPTEWADELIAAGRADKSTLRPIGAVRIGAVVKSGAPRPDVSTMDALRRALVDADAVLLTNAPTGDHLLRRDRPAWGLPPRSRRSFAASTPRPC